jgi:hypothetical protein
MVVATVAVALPDLDPHPAQWTTFSVHNAAGNMGNLPPGGTHVARHSNQIVILIQRLP